MGTHNVPMDTHKAPVGTHIRCRGIRFYQAISLFFGVSALSLGGHADAARPCLNPLACRVQEGERWISKGSSRFCGKPEQDPCQHLLLMVPGQLSE